MNRKATGIPHLATLASVLVLTLTSSASATPPHGKNWEFGGPLIWEVDHDDADGGEAGEELGKAMEGSGTWLRRNRGGIDGRVIATELTPGRIYTMNFIVFDTPDACMFPPPVPGLRCGLLDLIANPAAGGSYLWGDGKLAQRASVEFRGHRKVNSKSRVWIGDGLTNPAGAEITFDVLDMGPPIPGHVRDQRTSASFGCGHGEPNDSGTPFCTDIAGNGL